MQTEITKLKDDIQQQAKDIQTLHKSYKTDLNSIKLKFEEN